MKLPVTNIRYYEKTKIPFKSKHKFQNGFNWTNIQRLKNLNTGVLKVSPVSSNNSYFKRTRITIEYVKHCLKIIEIQTNRNQFFE